MKSQRRRSHTYKRRRAYRRMEKALVKASNAESLELDKEYRAKANRWYRVWYSLGGRYGEIK